MRAAARVYSDDVMKPQARNPRNMMGDNEPLLPPRLAARPSNPAFLDLVSPSSLNDPAAPAQPSATLVGLPLGAALSFFLAGSVAGGFAMLGVAGLLGVLFVMYKEQINLVTRLLGVAGHALVECSGLVGLAVGLQLALLLVVVPLVTMGVAAFTNGHLIFNPARSMTSPEQPNALDSLGGSGLGPLAKKGAVPELQCTNLSGDKVLCCTWEPEPWVPFYMALLSLALSWSTFLLFEVKVFTVAGTVAQWYFAPVSGPGGMTGGVAGRSPRSSRVGTSLSHALGPQLGSLCFSSAVLTLVSYLRQMLEKARREQGNNLLFCIFAYFANLFYTLIEFCTKFATVQMALTGQAFMPAAHSVVDLLRRNFLDAFGVWWLPPLILQNCAFLAAATFGGGMWAAGYASLGGFSSGPAPAPGPEGEAAATSPMAVAVMLAVIAFLCAWVVLAFFCALLLNVVDAVFLCFALDRDMRTCTRVEVHQVYCCLPTVGPKEQIRHQVRLVGSAYRSLWSTGMSQLQQFATLATFRSDWSFLDARWYEILRTVAQSGSADVTSGLHALMLEPFGVIGKLTFVKQPVPGLHLGMDILNTSSTSEREPALKHVAGPTECGEAEGCFVPAFASSDVGTKWWGYVGAVSTVPEAISMPDSLVYRILAIQPDGEEVVMSSRSEPLVQPQVYAMDYPMFADSSDTFAYTYHESFASLLCSLLAVQWRMEVAPRDGWVSPWRDGVLVLVVLLSLILCGLLTAFLVHWRMHQMLLFSLVPKTLVAQLREGDAFLADNKELGLVMQGQGAARAGAARAAGGFRRRDSRGGGGWGTALSCGAALALCAGTPAERMLVLLGQVLHGLQPRVSEVLYLKAALLQSWNLYQPLDLGKQLQERNVEVGSWSSSQDQGQCGMQLQPAVQDDVARSLMRELQGLQYIQPEPPLPRSSHDSKVCATALVCLPALRVQLSSVHSDSPEFSNLADALAALVAPAPDRVTFQSECGHTSGRRSGTSEQGRARGGVLHHIGFKRGVSPVSGSNPCEHDPLINKLGKPATILAYFLTDKEATSASSLDTIPRGRRNPVSSTTSNAAHAPLASATRATAAGTPRSAPSSPLHLSHVRPDTSIGNSIDGPREPAGLSAPQHANVWVSRIAKQITARTPALPIPLTPDTAALDSDVAGKGNFDDEGSITSEGSEEEKEEEASPRNLGEPQILSLSGATAGNCSAAPPAFSIHIHDADPPEDLTASRSSRSSPAINRTILGAGRVSRRRASLFAPGAPAYSPALLHPTVENTGSRSPPASLVGPTTASLAASSTSGGIRKTTWTRMKALLPSSARTSPLRQTAELGKTEVAAVLNHRPAEGAVPVPEGQQQGGGLGEGGPDTGHSSGPALLSSTALPPGLPSGTDVAQMSSGHTSRATSGPAGNALAGTLQALAHSLRSQQAVGGRLGKSKSFKRQATAVPPVIVDEVGLPGCVPHPAALHSASDSSSSSSPECVCRQRGCAQPACQSVCVCMLCWLQLEQFLVSGADQWTFDAFRLDELSSGHALSTLAFYLLQSTGLMKQHSIRGVKVARFLRAIEAGYQANAYHNATHAADVLQTMHVVLQRSGMLPRYADPLTHLACLLAAAVHDLEHVGLTNDFLNNSDHDLAIRYNDRSPMENHHLAACFSLLQQPHLNFLSHFAKDVKDKLRKMVIELVLATDMKNHMAITSQFSTVHSLMAKPAASTHPVAEPHEARSSARSSKGTAVSGPTPQLASQATGNAGGDGAGQGSLPGPCEPLDEAERLLSLQVALKCADIGMIAEGQEVNMRWVQCLEQEFFAQGDKEKAAGLTVSPLMDRDKPGVSKSQVAFYDFVGTPMFQNFTRVFPGMQPMMDQLQANYRYWKDKFPPPPPALPAPAPAPTSPSLPAGDGPAEPSP
ncbi:hypothetical protein QJQ45_024571 [Haematococcus lacustris]|nr:hypothetical protein QJQ45_024571 [Haematococcus lacustris]